MSEFGNAKTLPSLDPQSPQVKTSSWKRWRRRICYLLIGLCIGAALGLHFLPGPLLAQTLRGIVRDGGLRMTEPSHSSLSLITSQAAMNDVAIYKDKHAEALLAWETLDFHADTLSFLFTDTYALDAFRMEGLRINLRYPNDYQGSGSWEDYFHELQQQWDEQRAQQPSRSKKSKLRIQHMQLRGDAILWPQESDFDIRSFQLDAHDYRDAAQTVQPTPLKNKCLAPEALQVDDLQEELVSSIHINGAADAALSFETQILQYTDAQRVSLVIKQIPSDALKRHRISKALDNILRSFGPSGSCDLHFFQQIKGDARSGRLLLCSDNVLLNPSNSEPEHLFSANIRNLAIQMRKLRSLDKHAPVEWMMSWEQTGAQTIKIDYGMHKLFKQLSQRIQTLEAARNP